MVKRTTWIDVAKFVAILAVMIDHTNKVLYTNKAIMWFSYYSVSLFVLLMGITMYWSLCRTDEVKAKIWNKCWTVLCPYILATFIYTVLENMAFDMEVFIYHLIHFDASGQLYYVFLYIQLVIVSPIIVLFFMKAEKIKWTILVEGIGLIVVTVFSSFTTRYTSILDIYGGGGCLFGGTYLILLYIGIWCGKHYKEIKSNKVLALVLFFINVILTITWWQFLVHDELKLDERLPFGKGKNPPGISFCLYAVLMALTIYALGMIIDLFQIVWLTKLFEILAYLGRHTLYIFLYHLLFFVYIIGPLFENMHLDLNIWIKRLIYFVVAVGGSLLLESVFVKLKKFVKEAYKVEV